MKKKILSLLLASALVITATGCGAATATEGTGGEGLNSEMGLGKVDEPAVDIEFDGGVVEDDFYFGAISNTTSVAGVFKYDNIKLNDGYFELLLVRGLKSNFDAFGILFKIISKDYSGNNIIFTKTKHVKITCDKNVPWTLDGEFGGSLGDVEINVLGDAYDIYSENTNLFAEKEDAEYVE